MRSLSFLLLFISACFFFSSCEPDDEKLNTSPNLKLSFKVDYGGLENQGGDTLKFDTVFVQTGSITKRIWVFNRDRNAVNIERIELARASGNQYSLIINGQETNALNNVRLRGEDSLLVLVKVSINPNDETLPFVVDDSVTFRTNGNLQYVKLFARGQNAYFHLPGAIDCSKPWAADKPHVLYGDIIVPQGCTLNIDPGAKIYGHAGAGIYVAGTLMVNGAKDERVIFRGDRLDKYEDSPSTAEVLFAQRPGQWVGIVFLEGLTTTSKITYADIKYAQVGVYVGANNTGGRTDVELRHCLVKNMSSHGLIAYTSNVFAENCIFTNAGEAAVGTYAGGTYRLNYCTIANYDSRYFNHDKPSAYFEDKTKLSNGTFAEADLTLEIYNSIIWGDIEDEFVFAKNRDNSQLTVANNIIRTKAFKAALEAANQISQERDYPEFYNPANQDFRPDSASSPAINKGQALGGFLPVTEDVFGKTRPLGGANPDLGAIEVEDGI